MTPDRFHALTRRYPRLRIALLGDFCLDRYLEIDPARQERSIETGLVVHNVVRVRSQPGATGTILNNLVALRVEHLRPIGFCGEDGEGYELQRALERMPGVKLDGFLATPERRTFTYCKPLLLEAGTAPRELNRLDSKNWSPTPENVTDRLIAHLQATASDLDALILLDQVEVADTGVITPRLLEAVAQLARARPELLVVADSRRGLKGYPRVSYKMNRLELGTYLGLPGEPPLENIEARVRSIAEANGAFVFVSLAEHGIVAADRAGHVARVPALPVRGPIDVVGAGDAVMANLVAALASGADLPEALELAMAAASIVLHQLGTTGTANVDQLREILTHSQPR